MKAFLRLIFLVFILTNMPLLSLAQKTIGGLPKSFSLQSPNARLADPVIPENTIPEIDNKEELEKAQKINPNYYGLINAVNVDIIKQGYQEELPDGGKLWRYKISSTSAYSMEVIFSRFFLPNKAQLFIYNEDHTMVLGALSALNNSDQRTLATQPIFGSTIIIEYYEPAGVEFRGEIVIGEVVHDFANVLQFVKGLGPFVPNPMTGYGDVSCIKNVSCPEAAPYADQAKAVGLILYKMPGGRYVGHATGTLINNSDNDGTPYFLTAFHNIDASNAVCSDGTDLCFSFDKWVVLFNHYDPDCNGDGHSIPNSVNAINSVTGAKRLSGDREKDYLLMRLNSTPEYNVCYAGWSRTSSPQPPFVDIHHPHGDVKKISFYNRQLGSGVPVFWEVDNWNSGYTAPGSSGSALFDNNKRIVGVLKEGDGGDLCETDPNYNPRIDPQMNPDGTFNEAASSVFSRFSTSFDHGHFGVYLGNVQQTDTYCPVFQACPGNTSNQRISGTEFRTLSTCMEVNFEADKTEALVNEEVTFTNMSSGGVGELTYEWNFGADAMPATSDEEEPSAVYYTTTGLKWVTLTVCDDEGCITEQKSAYIDVQNSSTSMLVDFTAARRYVEIGEEIEFTSTVSGNESSVTYLWNFGLDADASSEVTSDPVVSFSSSGMKTISLQVTDNTGAMTEIKNAFISVNEPRTLPLRADFGGCPPIGLRPGSNVTFTDASSGGSTYPLSSYLWDFGDGTTSTSMYGSHVYNDIGVYTVSLTVCDGDNCDTKTSEGCVNISDIPSSSAAYLINGRAASKDNPIYVGCNVPVVYSRYFPESPEVDYVWEFDRDAWSVPFAIPATATSYGPHTVFYTSTGYYSSSLFVRNYKPMPYTLWQKDVKIDAVIVVPGMGAGDCQATLGNVSLSTTCWSKDSLPEFNVDVASHTCPYVIKIRSAKTGQFLQNNKIDFSGTNLPVFPYTDTYTISLAHNDCQNLTLLDSKTMTVTLYNSGANAGPDIVVCPGNELQLGSTSKSNTTYSWSCNPSTGVNYLSNATISNPKFNTVVSGFYNYTINARDLTSGCVTTDDVKITIQPVTVGNKTINTCMGGIESLNLPIAGGAGGFTGVWTPATYLSNANILAPTMQAPQLGTSLLYNLTVTDSKGCKGTGTALVNVSAVAPSGLVTVAGSREVKLTWIDNSNTETAYVVERSTTSTTTGFVVIATLAENTITYTDNTAALGVTYYYRVYPKNATTPNLGYSNTSSAYTNIPFAWNKIYGGTAAETDVKIYPTSDGGYIVGSTTESDAGGDVTENHKNGVYIGGSRVMWIVKLDACGNKVWDKKINVLEQTYEFRDFLEVSDGYVLLGRKWLPNSGAAYNNSLSPFETYVTKISKSGVKIWERTYGNVNAENPCSIIPSGDGGFIIANTSNSPAGRDKSQGYFDTANYYYHFPNYDLWIFKIDANGNKVWDKTIGNMQKDEVWPSICASSDGGYLIFSTSRKERNDPNPILTMARLTKIDASGNRTWTKTYLPTTGSYEGTPTIIKTSDGNYIIGTVVDSNNDYVLIKVDPNGNVLWNKQYGGTGIDYLTSIKEFPNGDLMIGGYSNSSKSGNKSESSYAGTQDFWIIRTDQAGTILWDKNIRGTANDYLETWHCLQTEVF